MNLLFDIDVKDVHLIIVGCPLRIGRVSDVGWLEGVVS
jgi:hypothetical protein